MDPPFFIPDCLMPHLYINRIGKRQQSRPPASELSGRMLA
jgi:hypothetical protein